MQNKEPKIKKVKKANAWCKTEWVDNKQKQTWFSDEQLKEEIK